MLSVPWHSCLLEITLAITWSPRQPRLQAQGQETLSLSAQDFWDESNILQDQQNAVFENGVDRLRCSSSERGLLRPLLDVYSPRRWPTQPHADLCDTVLAYRWQVCGIL